MYTCAHSHRNAHKSQCHTTRIFFSFFGFAFVHVKISIADPPMPCIDTLGRLNAAGHGARGERLSKVNSAKSTHKRPSFLSLTSYRGSAPCCQLNLAGCSVADIMQMFLMFYLRNYEASHFLSDSCDKSWLCRECWLESNGSHVAFSFHLCLCSCFLCGCECSSVLCLNCDTTLQKKASLLFSPKAKKCQLNTPTRGSVCCLCVVAMDVKSSVNVLLVLSYYQFRGVDSYNFDFSFGYDFPVCVHSLQKTWS